MYQSFAVYSGVILIFEVLRILSLWLFHKDVSVFFWEGSLDSLSARVGSKGVEKADSPWPISSKVNIYPLKCALVNVSMNKSHLETSSQMSAFNRHTCYKLCNVVVHFLGKSVQFNSEGNSINVFYSSGGV